MWACSQQYFVYISLSVVGLNSKRKLHHSCLGLLSLESGQCWVYMSKALFWREIFAHQVFANHLSLVKLFTKPVARDFYNSLALSAFSLRLSGDIFFRVSGGIWYQRWSCRIRRNTAFSKRLFFSAWLLALKLRETRFLIWVFILNKSSGHYCWFCAVWISQPF